MSWNGQAGRGEAAGSRAPLMLEPLEDRLLLAGDVTVVLSGVDLLIIGDGPIGLTFLQLVKLMGAGYTATSGRRPRRRELALELGADEALDATIVDLTARFRAGWRGALP